MLLALGLLPLGEEVEEGEDEEDGDDEGDADEEERCPPSGPCDCALLR